MEQGRAEIERFPQVDHPDRKVYRINDDGQAELLKWLAGTPPLSEPRSSPLIQAFFAGQLQNEDILAKFESFAARMHAILAHYNQVPVQIELYQQEIASPREHFFCMLTLDNGIRSMRSALKWAENVIKQIKAGKVPQN